jgi:predicted ATPase
LASHSELNEHLRFVRGVRRPKDGFFLRAESFYNVGTEIERLDSEPSFGPPIKDFYGGKSLHDQSHGEAFFSLFVERFGGEGFYILDEPEAALSPQRQMAFLSRLHELVKSGSQFLIATHSPIIMAYPNAKILLLDDKGLNPVSYTETDHYRITRQFLSKHEKMLDLLLANDSKQA